MRAMVLKNPSPIEESPLSLEDVPIPSPSQDDVIVKVGVCGVCHTDLHEIEGELVLSKLPIIPGHQVVGTVVGTGKKVSSLKVGERVGIAWLHRTCGVCRFCLNNRENLCLNPQFTGWQVDGGYAEYIAAPAGFVYPIPQSLKDDEKIAPLLCGGIIGYRSLRQAEIRPGCRLGLYGFGASAHIALQIALHWNCRVFVFSRTREHRALAVKLGAEWAGSAGDDPPEPLDSSVIFAPAGQLIPEALRALDKGGTVALAGIYMSPIPPLEYDKHLYHEKTLRSVANATRQDGCELLKLASEIPIGTETEAYSLAEANKVLIRLKEGKVQGAAVLHITG